MFFSGSCECYLNCSSQTEDWNLLSDIQNSEKRELGIKMETKALDVAPITS